MEHLEATSLFIKLGEAEGMRNIVEAFYPIVQSNPKLAPLFPKDIQPVMDKQYLFLTQFFGGPTLFSNEHGHPMMRARHMGFEITHELAGEWLKCMHTALLQLEYESGLRDAVLERLSGPAYHFVNSP